LVLESCHRLFVDHTDGNTSNNKIHYQYLVGTLDTKKTKLKKLPSALNK